MGVKLLILLALLVGVLYSLHLLAKDYQAISAPRLLMRFLFKRDLRSQNQTKPNVRWKKILNHDPIQCARVFYCGIGVGGTHGEVRQGFTYMLSLEPKPEDALAHQVYIEAYNHGKLDKENSTHCSRKYPMCPFSHSVLFDLVVYLIKIY